MLQSIRDRTQGWIAGIIISLIILSFALWGIHSYLGSSGNNEVVAKVNGAEISKRQLAAAFVPLRNQAQMSLGSSLLPPAMESRLRQQALDSLINIQVLRQASIASHYTIFDAQVDNYLEKMPDFQVNGEFSLNRLKQILANNMLSISDFLELIKTTLLIDQPRLGVVLSSFALPDEVNTAVALVNQERDVSYLTLPYSNFLSAAATINDADIKAYYQQHEKDFKTAQQVTVDYLELTLNDLIAAQHPDDEAIKKYYNENINSFTVPAKWNLEKILIPVAETTTQDQIDAALKKINDLKTQVKNGADFVALARQYPDTGVNRVWITLSELPVETQKTVATMTHTGDVSEPIKVANGLMLIKVIDYKDAQVQPFAEVQDKVKETLSHQLAEEKYADLRDKLASITYEHPESLAPAASALGLTVKTSAPFTYAKGNNDDISTNRKVRDAAFSDDVLASQNNSDAIQVGADKTLVLRLKSQVPATLLPLQTVTPQITDQLKNLKAEQLAANQANEIKQKLQSGAAPDQIAAEYHLTWSTQGYIGRYSHKIDAAILYTAFGLPRSNKALYATAKIPNGYAVVASNGVHDGVINSADKEQYDVFADQVQTSQGLLEYKLYEDSLMAKAKISVYTDTPNTEDAS